MWKEILTKVIYYKNIIEYDYTGFFNTVRHESVGKILDRLQVPKPVIAHLLKLIGMHTIEYCDDGLFYSNTDIDFLSRAQEKLDYEGIGCYFSPGKCRWIKRDNVWINKLKIVGLEYDPFKDLLSASTRKGATLELAINVLGIFSDQTPKLEETSDQYPKREEISPKNTISHEEVKILTTPLAKANFYRISKDIFFKWSWPKRDVLTVFTNLTNSILLIL